MPPGVGGRSQMWGSPAQPAPNGGTATPGPGNPTNALDFCPSSYPTLWREVGAGGLQCCKGNLGPGQAGGRGPGDTTCSSGRAQGSPRDRPGGAASPRRSAGCGVHAHAQGRQAQPRAQEKCALPEARCPVPCGERCQGTGPLLCKEAGSQTQTLRVVGHVLPGPVPAGPGWPRVVHGHHSAPAPDKAVWAPDVTAVTRPGLVPRAWNVLPEPGLVSHTGQDSPEATSRCLGSCQPFVPSNGQREIFPKHKSDDPPSNTHAHTHPSASKGFCHT